MVSILKGHREDHSAIGSAARRARALFGRLGAAVVLICVVPLQSCGQATESTPGVYDVPAAIDATGTNDVTTDLLAFFASVPDGSTINFPGSATYRIENTLLLKNRNNLTFEGNGVHFIANTDGSGVIPDPLIKGPPSGTAAWPRGRRHWMFVGGAGIKVRNMTIRGAHPSGGANPNGYVANREAQHGIEFMATDHVEVDNLTITDVYGDFVGFIQQGSAGSWTHGAWIHNCTGARNGRQGIAIGAGEDILIENNNFSDMARAVVDIEPNFSTGVVKRVAFRNNVVGSSMGYFFANVGSGNAVYEDILIENNVLDGNALQMLIGSPTMTVRRSRYTIRNNTSNLPFNSLHSLITVYRTDGIVVTGNTNPMQVGSSMIAVATAEVCQAQVSSNIFVNALQEWQNVPWTGCP